MRRSTVLLASVLLIGACSDDDPIELPPPAPRVTTGERVAAGTDTATVDGTVDTFGASGTYWFEFGTEPDFGDTTVERSVPRGVAGPQLVQSTLTGLDPETRVLFRLVARTEGGRAEGEVSSFVTRSVNQPPDTQVTAAGADTTGSVVRAPLFWFGSDPDGEVARFEWRFVDHGADGALDVPDSLGVPWTTTAVTDSSFTWQDGTGSRTFFVRAVDDRLARDPTPASWTFDATVTSTR